MAFQGYLLKIEGVILPLSYIKLNTYISTPNQFLDLEATRNSNGRLIRTVAANKPSTIEFETPVLSLSEMTTFKNYFITKREKVTVEYWNDESATYVTDSFYVPDLKYKILSINGNNIMYDSCRVAFIGY